MGAESFYVKSSVVNNGISKDDFLSQLNNLNVIYSSITTYEYELEEFLIMTVHSDYETIRELSIEGCFSWFHECTLKIYEILLLIHTCIFPISLKDHDGNCLAFTSKEDFLFFVNELYREKYKDFNIRYGEMNIRCLPRERFYSSINGKRKKSIIKRLFK
ncbi:hypothetical protein PAECIP111893_03595 [Paenibacillus plantiphilus]|uniref:Uncharacterized protein n=1 Tax=Paenibacillus plantiphilus TaxID=2905650 RepID=A0ABN8GQT1_9BACL|nr:hypothetical protein PAECIP111893_03595 [Paenibacillus plantiphilus]